MPKLTVAEPTAPTVLEGLVRDYLASCRARGLAPSTENQAYAYGLQECSCRLDRSQQGRPADTHSDRLFLTLWRSAHGDYAALSARGVPQLIRGPRSGRG